MSFIICDSKCKACGEPQVKDPMCGGDYHFTINGYVLQRYCNGDCVENGIMYPELEKKEIIFLSKRKKLSIAGRCSAVYNLHYRTSKKIAKSINENSLYSFAFKLSEGLGLSIYQVLRCCM